MKVEFSNRSEKLLIIAIATLIILIVLTAFQSMNNKSLRVKIRENNISIQKHNEINNNLIKKIDSLEFVKTSIIKKIDSVTKKENYFKYKYYSTNEKLKKIISGYDNSPNDTKNELFTNAINN